MKKFNNVDVWVHNDEFYRVEKISENSSVCDGCCFNSTTGKCDIAFHYRCTIEIGTNTVFKKISESEVNNMKNKLKSSGKIKVMTMTEERSLYIFNLLKERGMNNGLDLSSPPFSNSPNRDKCTILYMENGVIIGWDNVEEALENSTHLYWTRTGFKEYCYNDVVELILSVPIKNEEVKLPFKCLDYVLVVDSNTPFVTQFVKIDTTESKFLCLHNIHTQRIAPFDPNKEDVMEYDEYYTFENKKLIKVKK